MRVEEVHKHQRELIKAILVEIDKPFDAEDKPFDEDQGASAQMALFPEDRRARKLACTVLDCISTRSQIALI